MASLTSELFNHNWVPDDIIKSMESAFEVQRSDYRKVFQVLSRALMSLEQKNNVDAALLALGYLRERHNVHIPRLVEVSVGRDLLSHFFRFLFPLPRFSFVLHFHSYICPIFFIANLVLFLLSIFFSRCFRRYHSLPSKCSK
jgi:hypothetical protein